ncbi:MAG: FG-GAP-like repeat-containing protein, partial [Cyclobacteriaceae bacterium]
MKLAAIGGTVAALTPFNNVEAQVIGPFTQQTRLNNPLRPPLPGVRLKATSVDLDNDGDFDIAFGTNYGYLKLFINNGSGDFEETEILYATYSGPYGNYTSPFYSGNSSFADLDADGDLDLVVAALYSSAPTRFYLNNGDGNGSIPPTFTIQNTPWNGATGNPFYSINPIQNQNHFFVDYDVDGDLDLFISGTASAGDEPQLLYYENNGASFFSTGSIPNLPPLYGDDYGNRVRALVADLDEDGDLDLIVGDAGGNLNFFISEGSNFVKQSGPWDPTAKTGNPFDGIVLLNGPVLPSLIDLDLDGDLDI